MKWTNRRTFDGVALERHDQAGIVTSQSGTTWMDTHTKVGSKEAATGLWMTGKTWVNDSYFVPLYHRSCIYVHIGEFTKIERLIESRGVEKSVCWNSTSCCYGLCCWILLLREFWQFAIVKPDAGFEQNAGRIGALQSKAGHLLARKQGGVTVVSRSHSTDFVARFHYLRMIAVNGYNR